MNVFQFRLSQLERIIKNEKEQKKEKDFLTKRFEEWRIPVTDTLTLQDSELRKIICLDGVTDEEGAELTVRWADRLGAIFKSTGLSSSQIRNFFGEVRTIEQTGFDNVKMRRRFMLLLPKLQYAKARARNFGTDSLTDVLSESIRYVDNQPACFQRFVEFFEAILAYHKAYGGN